MANIKVKIDHPISDGAKVKFRTPCESTSVDGLVVTYPIKNGVGYAVKNFTFMDAHGKALSGLGNVFASDVMIEVLLDVTKGRAYIQNANSNTYIEDIKLTVQRMDAERQTIFADAGRVVKECNEATKKANDAAKGVVTVEQNTQKALRFWVGNEEEYQSEKDSIPANTFCIIDGEDSYGLGRTCIWLGNSEDIDDVRVNGWYAYGVDNQSPNKPNNSHADLFVIARTANIVTQIAVLAESLPTFLVRKYTNGTWEEWEWINPPMKNGVEYRTTKRYNGRPVYAMCQRDELTGSGVLNSLFDIADVTDIVDIKIMYKSTDEKHQSIICGSGVYAQISDSSFSVWHTTDGNSPGDYTVCVEYCKA